MFVVFVEFFYIIIMYICWVLSMCDLLCTIIINKLKWLHIYWSVLRLECLNTAKYKAETPSENIGKEKGSTPKHW